MIETASNKLLADFNQMHKSMEAIYHNYAMSCGLSDSAFWLLYSVAEHQETYTQAELCLDWSFSPKTINSALKLLEKKGLVKLVGVSNNRKSKRISFTSEGRKLYKRYILPVMQAEDNALSALTPQEQSQLLFLTKKNKELLVVEIKKIKI
ncbi:MAG: helix-turn-helix domain-containing protein [Bacilli bacterium]